MVTNNSIEVILQNHNNRDLMKVLPAILFLGTIMLVGLIGNSLVLYIYMTKLKPTTIRSFIIGLAVIDVNICLFDIPLMITELRYQYTFGSYVKLCKVVHTFHDFLFIGAAFLLLAVAAERYRKVCQPYKKQMTIRTGKITCVVSCTLAAISSIPAYFIYGTSTVQLKNSSVNGTRCARADDSSPVVLHVSYVFWITLDFSSTIILIMLYTLIWYKVLRHLRSNKRGVTFTNTETIAKSNERTARPMDASETDLDELDLNRPVRMNLLHSREYIADQLETTIDQPARNHGKTKPRDLGVSRMTRTMFWVTIVTIFAFLPIIFRMAIEMHSKETLKKFEESLSSFHEIFMRSYYIQCASNPLLYFCFNTSFQFELKRLFKQ